VILILQTLFTFYKTSFLNEVNPNEPSPSVRVPCLLQVAKVSKGLCLDKLKLTGQKLEMSVGPGNTKGESITVPLTSCLTGVD
jgi:hypothetical protein